MPAPAHSRLPSAATLGAAIDPETRRGFEGWLRRPTRLALLALGMVALATAMNSIGAIESRQSRGFGPSVGNILGYQAVNWSLLVALATPLGYWAVALGRKVHAALYLAALLLTSSLVAGVLFLQQQETWRWVTDFERPQRAEGERTFPRGERAQTPEGEVATEPATEPATGPTVPSEPVRDGAPRRGAGRGLRQQGGRGFGGSGFTEDSLRWALRFRLPRVLLATWAFVGLGAALRLFLDTRERERDTRRLQLRASALEGELAVAQLETLRAQIHPHFLFNALHSIGGLVRSGRSDEALSTLDALGGLLRLGLDARGAGLVPLSDELVLLERYLDVERVRLGDRLRVELDIPEECVDDEIPPFLLQPLVENAVRYAVAERAEGGLVRITARAHGHRLVVDVDDDGPGFSEEALAGEGWGIGLANVRARLTTLFEREGALELSRSSLGGARARVSLPRDAEDAS